LIVLLAFIVLSPQARGSKQWRILICPQKRKKKKKKKKNEEKEKRKNEGFPNRSPIVHGLQAN
jgi:hypothetical protein